MSELLEKILHKDNMNAAYKRVCANKGAERVASISNVYSFLIIIYYFIVLMKPYYSADASPAMICKAISTFFNAVS